jgi:hypothetical protein
MRPTASDAKVKLAAVEIIATVQLDIAVVHHLGRAEGTAPALAAKHIVKTDRRGGFVLLVI